MKFLNLFLVSIFVFALNACGGGSSSAPSGNTNTASQNNAPEANAGSDTTVVTNSVYILDGLASIDNDGDALTFLWSLVSKPTSSNAQLDDVSIARPRFTADLDGQYIFSLTVNDGSINSLTSSVAITSLTGSQSVDSFEGNGLLLGYTVNNPNSLPSVTRKDGRYNANLVNNANNITLHFNAYQGRLDAKIVSFPFEVIARNIGIGTQDDSQVAPQTFGSAYIFAGIQVHDLDLELRNSSHFVVGHRGSTSFTVEGKNTVNSSSSVNDEGALVAGLGRADIRIVGNADNTLTVYWQQPNFTATPDNWLLYRNTGKLPGTAPVYDDTVYVGLITYAQGQTGVPFVGTCDSFEIID